MREIDGVLLAVSRHTVDRVAMTVTAVALIFLVVLLGWLAAAIGRQVADERDDVARNAEVE